MLIMLKIVENQDSKAFNSKVCACATDVFRNAEFLIIIEPIREFSSSFELLSLLEVLFEF